jgi:glycosyltransferase involved in cell wall biosynthesis
LTQNEDCTVVFHSQSVRRALRVAVVTETYPPEVNGVAATASRVVEGLRERGHVMQLLRPRQNEQDLASEKKGLHQVLLRGLPIPRYPELKMGLPCKKTLINLWQTGRPDVVHIVTEGPLGWSALQAATQLSLPVVSDFRTNFHAYSLHYGMGWLSGPVMGYLRKFHNRTACTMVPTASLRSELLSKGFEKLNVVARGVDTQLFNPARRSDDLRRSWGAGPGTMVAMCVGRLAPEKNLDVVLDAFEAMRQQEPKLRLVLVGDGPDRARLMQRCPDAIFAGMRRGEDLAAHYASADVFLFASVTETFGNVVTEAMASGLAVVAYDHAAAGQLLRHGENGLLARCGDRPEFCRVARRLAGELHQAQALGAAARNTAMRLDWGRIVDAVEAVYGAAILGTNVRPLSGWKPALPAV